MAGKFKFVAIAVVALGLVMGVAFGLGVQYGHGNEKTAESGVTLAQIQQMVGGGGGGGAGGAGTGGSGAAGAGSGGTQGAGGATNGGSSSSTASARSSAGRITAVQGQTVTIELRPGVTQKLNLGATTVVNKFLVGAPADLKEGSSVLVSGTRKDDGSFDVTTINIVAPELVQAMTTTTTTGAAPAPAPAASPAAGAPAPAPAAPSGR